ncbi:hypothetical protein [Leekyejoonella antrihumi]|uniref:Heavy metal transporter n=1 Tax=Leekyejoonella antrihumi TaxID=1660198 RepID=A0A563DWF6_9MICO|nr:hypothetical protein [Leekyejoonella antrihumi]TWP34546.1 hypothetical protein FGL98_16750 [Leekyejoonella antrihumi]
MRSRGHDREFEGLYDVGPDVHDDAFYDEEYHRRGPIRRALGCLLPLAILGGVVFGGYQAYQHLINNFGSPSCKVVSGNFDYQWDPEQAANASTITDVGLFKLGLPNRASDIALTTALQESKLRNLTYGDLDSIGLFQQRPSQGWGTSAQIQDPVFASTSFYHALVKVAGWQQLSVASAAQAVQKSGFPSAYDAHTTQGETLTAVLSGATPEGIGCRLDSATSSTAPAALVTKLAAQSGVQATASTSSVTYRAPNATAAQAIGAWAVAHAQSDGVTSVTVGDRAWQRDRGQDGWTWHPATSPTSSGSQVRINLAGR